MNKESPCPRAIGPMQQVTSLPEHDPFIHSFTIVGDGASLGFYPFACLGRYILDSMFSRYISEIQTATTR